jgi:hypothetical protein
MDRESEKVGFKMTAECGREGVAEPPSGCGGSSRNYGAKPPIDIHHLHRRRKED